MLRTNRFWPSCRATIFGACMAVFMGTAGAQAAPVDGVSGVASEPAWSAAWQAPQGDAFLSVSAQKSTLRQILTTHAAGTQVRLRLSNLYGGKPVRIGAGSIGVSAGGAEIAGAGPVALRFGGHTGVELAPGESRYSDPVALPVQAMQRLAVSLYIPDSALSMSRHFNGNELIWTAQGDASAQATAQGFSRNSNLLLASHVLMDRLDVIPADASPRRVVAMFGDSITDGFMGSASGIPLLPGNEPIGRDLRFPDFLQRRAQAEGVQATFVSAAISGNRLLSGPALPMFGPAGQGRLARDVTSLPGVTDAVVLLGINDLGFALFPSVTAQNLITSLQDVLGRLHAAHIRVTVGTLLPSRGASFGLAHGSAAVDAARKTVNQWIRTSGVPDAVIDFEPCMQDPLQPSRLRQAYDSGDGLHPNGVGYAAMAACVNLSGFTAGL